MLRHVIGRIRARWPAVEIVVRGDSHYGRPKAMAWCERQQVGYIFGLSGNPVLLRQVSPLTEDAALGRLADEGEKVRRYGDFRYAAKSWNVERRRHRPRRGRSSRGRQPLHRRQPAGSAQDALREGLLRARAGRKPDQGAQTASGFRPCLLHQGDREPIPAAASYRRLLADARACAVWLAKTSFWRDAQFDTIRLCLIKVAGRVTEMVTRIKIALPSAFPYQAGFADLAGRIAKLPP